MFEHLSSMVGPMLLLPFATFFLVFLLRLPALVRSEVLKPRLKDLSVFATGIFGIFFLVHFLVRPLAGFILPISPPVWVSRVGEIPLFFLIFLWVVRVWSDGVVGTLTGRTDGELKGLVGELERRIRGRKGGNVEIRRSSFETFAVSVMIHILDRIEAVEKEIEVLKDHFREEPEAVEDRGEDAERPPKKEVEGEAEEEKIPEIPSEETRQKSEFAEAVGELKNALKGSAGQMEIVEKFRGLKNIDCAFNIGKSKGKEYLKVRKSIGDKKYERSLGRVSPRVRRMAEEAGVDL